MWDVGGLSFLLSRLDEWFIHVDSKHFVKYRSLFKSLPIREKRLSVLPLNYLFFGLPDGLKFTWRQSFDRLTLISFLLTVPPRFALIWRYVNSAAWVLSLSPQPREFIRLLWGAEEGQEASASYSLPFDSILITSAGMTDRGTLSAVIEGIDFPTLFGAHWRDTIRGFGFQKTSSSALIIWSIISIKTKDLQQSLLQCLYFLSSVGLQICWVKVISTDQKVSSKQQHLTAFSEGC